MTALEFKQLFERYFDSLRSYLYYRSGDQELSTDIAQEVFMRFWEKQFTYNPKENAGLLYKMASDLFVSRYRKQQVEMKYRKELKFDLNDESPEEQVQYNELKENYEKALAQLSEKQRVVFLMSRMEGLKYHEIAERLDISVKAVEKRMKYALAVLKTSLNIS